MKWLALLLATTLFATPAQIVIIPNAESSNGTLTQMGLERAGALPPYLLQTPNFTAPIAVFAQRPTLANPAQACIQTVAPTAQTLQLPIHSGFSNESQIAGLILADPTYNGQSVLICWRTADIPALATALGVSSPPTSIPNVTWVISGSSLQIYPQNLLANDNTFFCGCGSIASPSNTGYVTPEPIIDSQVWSFVSEPDLHPMKITVNTNLPGTAAGSIFLAPYAFSSDACYGQQGSLIVDNEGNPIWFRPTSNSNLMNTDFRVQEYKGSNVLTFWQGTLATPLTYTNSPAGSSEPGSCYYILDNTYEVIKNISAQNGYTSDIHEFLITPTNTALFLSTKSIPMDLTPYGGPQNGYVQDFAIQEVDIETNELLFYWNALAHIPLTDSFQPASSASESANIWDAYHFNSIGVIDTDHIIVSGRNTFTIYNIDKPSGNIVWQLGGKNSTFNIDPAAEFSWQHDARYLPGDIVTLFDDNCCESADIPPGTPYAHGLTLQLDLINSTATALTTYYHDPLINVASQGNVQTLSNGNKFVGWGQTQYYSEYAEAGNTQTDPSLNTLYDATFPTNNYTYRAYRNTWIGTPSQPPSLAVLPNTVYASWNGSTETATWEVYAGPQINALSLVATAPKTTFETAIEVSDPGPYFQLKALNASNQVIGVSSIVNNE